jgi:hypothetical protein
MDDNNRPQPMASKPSGRDPWCHIKILAWILLGAFLAFAVGFVLDVSASYNNEPPLVAGISGTEEEMAKAVTERFAAQFPPGTPSKTIIRELAVQGFEPDWETTERVKVAYLKVSHLVCLVTYRFTWTVDANGHLQEGSGQRLSACL